jgi:Protein of unknown function (DUF3408).
MTENKEIGSHSSNERKSVNDFMIPKKKEITDSIDEPETENDDNNRSSESSVETENPKIRTDSTRKKRIQPLSYKEIFLVRNELSTRQGLHLEKETIATIKRIVHNLGDERLTVSGFVENVIKHHFEMYQDEITRLYEEISQKPIINRIK